MRDFDVYLINLNRSKERLSRIDTELKKINIKYERITAVDSSSLSPEIEKFVTAPNYLYPHKLTRGEIACFLSHRSCWMKLINSNKRWALILEDHCEFSEFAKKYLESIKWIPQQCELIQLIYSPNPVFANKQIILPDGNILLGLSCTSPVGASAYYISREAALTAITESRTIDTPVDNFLFGPWSKYSKKVQGWRLLEATVKRAKICSTILDRGKENKKHNKERLHPKRLLKKLFMCINKIFLRKYYQTWEKNKNPL